MDRLLVSETPSLDLQDNGAGEWQQNTLSSGQNWRALANFGNSYWVHEDIIDLKGYTMNDMTAFFRQSFEQRGAVYSVQWQASASDPLNAFNAGFIESVIVSTVPMSDDNLGASILAAPGFITTSLPLLTLGNFNREMIIHGRLYLHGIDTALTADAFTADGAAYTRVVQEYDFSSLEPTGTDKLYVYRVLFFADPARGANAGLDRVFIPSARIMLDTNFAKEEDIPYLMRLKRGYELANQV